MAVSWPNRVLPISCCINPVRSAYERFWDGFAAYSERFRRQPRLSRRRSAQPVSGCGGLPPARLPQLVLLNAAGHGFQETNRNGRIRHDDAFEIPTRQCEARGRIFRHDRGGAGRLANERQFPEVIARPQRSNCPAALFHLGPPVDDQVEPLRWLARRDDRRSRIEAAFFGALGDSLEVSTGNPVEKRNAFELLSMVCHEIPPA